jgi:hypothetical protein
MFGRNMLPPCLVHFSTMKMEVEFSFPTSLHVYQTIRSHIQKPAIFIVTAMRTSNVKLFSFVDKKQSSILSIPSLKKLSVCVCVCVCSVCEIRTEGGNLLAHWIRSARLVTPAPLGSVNYETLELSETQAYKHTHIINTYVPDFEKILSPARLKRVEFASWRAEIYNRHCINGFCFFFISMVYLTLMMSVVLLNYFLLRQP